ncbi:MAG: YfhO family protein [Lachnospiraceae bacterium]|nr:YfhO family protein [Candidatus Minthocola equi]
MSKKTRYTFEEKLPLILSFVLPVLIMIGVLAGKSVWPFGDKCFLRTDLYHQYAPFLSELGDKLKNGGSLLYAWDIGLGSNYPATAAYYLCSPFNILMAIIPDSFVIEFLTIMAVIKIGLCGLTMAIYLSKKKQTRSLSITIFAICYALSGYMAAYNWNIMWLDVLWLAPLVIWGIEKLVKENKPFVYCIALAVSIFSNYYISIMLCIYLVLYFLALIIMLPQQRFVEYLKKIGLFALYSLIAGGLAAIAFLPAFFALSGTASGNFSFPTSLTSYFSVLEMLARQLTLVETEVGLEHWPNIYSGVIVLLTIPMYYLNKQIPLKEKIVKSALLVIMLLSFALNIPNYIWHGFHVPNSLPCRQSYTYTILLLTMCFEGFRGIKSMSKGKIVGCFWGSIAFILVLEAIIEAPEYQWYSYVVSAILVALYALAIYLYRSGRMEKLTSYGMIIAIMVVELGVNTAVTSVPVTSRVEYNRNKAEYTALFKAVSADKLFTRAERNALRTNNDACWFKYNSASIFSSTTPAAVTSFYKKLGCEGNTNAYDIKGATPFASMLLSVQYTFATEDLPESPLYRLASQSGDVRIYENLYTLSLGYGIPSDVNELWEYTSVNPAKGQNALANLLDEAGENILQAIPGTTSGTEYTTTTTERAHIFVFVDNAAIDTVTANYDGNTKKFVAVNRRYLLDLGYLDAGTDITIKSEKENQTMNAIAYEFSDEELIRIYNKLSASQLQLTDWNDSWFDTSFTGTINMTSDGSMLMSIPYEKGWTARVDGVITPIEKFSDALILIPLTAGTHTIHMSYVPEGAVQGAIISAGSLVLLAICLLISIVARLIRKNKYGDIDEEQEQLEEMFDIPEVEDIEELPEEQASDLTVDSVLAAQEETAEETAAAPVVEEIDILRFDSKNDIEEAPEVTEIDAEETPEVEELYAEEIPEAAEESTDISEEETL